MAEFTEARTRFTTKDKITPSFRDMDRGAKRFGKSASKSFRDATASASRFRDVTKGILAAGAISRGLRVLGQGLRSVTEQFIDFDKATIGAAARFKDIGPDAVDFEQQLKRIRDRAREAGATTEFTAAQSAEALNFLAKASFSSAEAMGSLSSMINLATATGEDFARVADISSDLLGAFGLNVDNTAQKIKNLARLNDVLVKAANTANVTVEDLFETMKDVGPIARKAGQSLESVTAVTAFLGGTGIKGTKAMTALKNAFLNLASPSTKAAVLLKEMDISVADSHGNMRDLNEIIGDLGPQLAKMGNVKALAILDEIFGKRAISGAANIADGTKAIREFERSLLDASGAAEKTAERLRKALGNRLLALNSAFTELGFKILEAFEVRGEGAIQRLTAAIRKFDPEPIIFGVGLAIDIFKTFWTILKPFVPFMPWFIGMWLAFGTVMKILAIANMASNFLLFWNSIRKVSGSMAILNAVMAANPVGAIILGLTALVALFVVVFKNWDALKARFDAIAANPFGKILIGMATLISGIVTLTILLVAVAKNWDRVKAGFNAFVENFKIGLQVIDRMFSALLNPVLEKIAAGLSFIGLGPPEVSEREGERTPPNQEEAAARQQVNFNGQINLNGFPPGTTTESETTGAPDIDFGALG